MRKFTALVLVASISACTATPEMVEAQKSKCAQIGYAAGSPDYLACVERGVSMSEAGMTATAASVTSSATALGIASALF